VVFVLMRLSSSRDISLKSNDGSTRTSDCSRHGTLPRDIASIALGARDDSRK